MSQEVIERSFPVTAPARLKLSNIRGKVRIEAGNDDQIAINATKHLDTGDANRTEVVMSQSEDGRVIVETKYSEWFLSIFNFSSPCKVDYLVKVPRACEVDVSVVSSALSIQAVEGSLTVSTVSGEVALKDLTGNLRFSSVSGKISGEALSGSLHMNTVSGGVILQGGSLSQGKAITVSGDIRINTTVAEGPYSFQSVSGNVFLTVSQSVGFTVNMHTVSGKLRTSLPINHRQKSSGFLSAVVGGGGVQISLNSVSGDLHLEGVPPAPEAQPESSHISQREVLERIERGEMTVEEALERLK